jgi:hypothetical protein
MTLYADIAEFDEDTRIEMIGNAVMSGPKSSADKPVMAAFVVEDDAKADHYIRTGFAVSSLVFCFQCQAVGPISARCRYA